MIHYYLALRAYDRFIQGYSRPPGLSDDTVSSDQGIMDDLVKQILGEEPADSEKVTNACAEMYIL